MGEQVNFILFADIEMDEDEKSYANIPYKLVDYETVDKRKVKVAAEKHSITERWDMWDQRDDDENKTKVEREDRRDKDKKERQKGGEVFDKDAAILDMIKLRVTDIPTNTRVFEPRAASGPEEVKIQIHKDEVMRTCKEYNKN